LHRFAVVAAAAWIGRWALLEVAAAIGRLERRRIGAEPAEKPLERVTQRPLNE